MEFKTTVTTKGGRAMETIYSSRETSSPNKGGLNMGMKHAAKIAGLVVSLFSVSMIFGCANYEVNTKRGNIPGHYIRY